MPADRGAPSVAALAARDPEGFAARTWRSLAPALYGSALRILRSPEEAEDVLQDGFVTMLSAPPEIPEASLAAWMRRVVINRALDVLRRRRRWATQEYEEARGDGTSPRDADARVDLERALDGLPERARLVLLLHDVEGLKHGEIGEILGVSPGTSKSQLSRARELMRARLGEGASTGEGGTR